MILKRTFVSRGTWLAIAVLAIIGLLEAVYLLGSFFTTLGTGDLSIETLPFSWNSKFQYAPLILIDWLNLPSSIAIEILLVVYHVLGGFFAFLLARAYMDRGQLGDGSRLPVIPLLAGILYMMFPWNAFGDNFPTLVLVRALAPLVLFLLLMALRTGRQRFSILGGLVLGLMTMADPRSIIFIIPISLFIVTIPELSVRAVSLGRAVKANLVFAVAAAAGSIVEIVYRLPGMVAGGTGTSSSSPAASINLDAFIPNFTHASPIQFLAGISFEATYQDFTGLLSGVPGLTTVAVLLGLAFTLTLALYGLFVLPRGEDRRRALIILATIAVATVLFTVWIPRDHLPFIYNILLSSDLVRGSSLLSTLMIMFRTMRFANLLLMLALVPLFTIVVQDLLPRWKDLRDTIKERGVLPQGGLRRALWDRKWQKMITLAVTFVLVFAGLGAWLLPQVVRGEGVSFRGGITFETTEESLELSAVIAKIDQDPTVERILAIQPVNSNLPNMYMYQDIEGGVSQYLVHYAVDTLYSPVIQDGDYDYLASLLTVMGVGYVVVNGHMIDSYYGGEYGERKVETPSFSTIVSGLENSSSFTKVAEVGEAVAFKVIEDPSSSEGLYVLGGLEDLRKAYSYIRNATGSDILPVMLDSEFDIENLSDLPDWPILVGAHKTTDDLTASLAMLSSTGVTLTPSEWTSKQWSPHNNWSPGYIQDKIGGGWSPLLLDITNYEWSFSYTPDTGYAYVEGAYDTISHQVDLENQDYVMLARVLYSPEGGKLSIDVNNNTYYLDTQWNNESSEFLWTSLGTMSLNSTTDIQLNSLGGVNAVNSILLVPKADWEKLQKVSSQFLEDREVIQVVDPEGQELNATTDVSSTMLSVLKGGNYSVISEDGANVSIGQMGNLSNGQAIDLDQDTYRTVFSDYLTTTYGEDFEYPSVIGHRGSNYWTLANSLFDWSIDNTTSTTEESSLNLTTGISNDRLWSNIRGPIVSVTPGQECAVSLDMKWYNAHQSHVTINGIREDGSYYRLEMLMPGQDGTSNWTHFSTTFTVPEGTVGIQIVLNAGGVYNSLYSTATTWFDNVTVKQAANYGQSLILAQDLSGTAGLQIDDPEVSVVDGFTNVYTFNLTEGGTGIASVPETYYGSSLEMTSNGPEVLSLPVYSTYLGLVLTNDNGSSGTVVVSNPLDALTGQLSEVVFVSMFIVALVITISFFWGPWRLTKGEKAYVRGRG